MCFDQVVCRAYAASELCTLQEALRNFVSPDLALRKCMSQEALGTIPETRPSASQDLGEDVSFVLGDGKSPLPRSGTSPLATVHFPQVSTNESILALRPSQEAHH